MTELTSILNHVWTVEELMAELKVFKPDQKVVFAYDYGDHSHSTVCIGVSSLTDGRVKYSDYHRMLKEAPDEDRNGETIDYAERGEEVEKVVIINLDGR